MSQWIKVTPLNDIPALGSRVVQYQDIEIAVFKNAQGQVFALKNKCPHKQGPLSEGIVHGSTVTCPLHAWKIDLATGHVLAPDEGCTNHYPTKIEDNIVWIEV